MEVGQQKEVTTVDGLGWVSKLNSRLYTDETFHKSWTHGHVCESDWHEKCAICGVDRTEVRPGRDDG